MDQQKPNQSAPERAYSAEEIARLEAEAVAAIQRGEPAPAAPSDGAPRAGESAGDAPRDFVPYVDDAPRPASTDAELDDDDEPYVPGAMEKRIDEMPPAQWRRWQIAGGAVVGLAAVACLFVFGEELSTYGLIVAVLLAVLLPRYLERSWRHSLTIARYAMIAAMLAGLIAMGVVILTRR